MGADVQLLDIEQYAHAGLSNLAFFVPVIFVVWPLIILAAERSRKNKRKDYAAIMQSAQQEYFQGSAPPKMEKKFPYEMEDRQGDWLAEQIRAERHSLVEMSAMFDLKMEHARHCDANGIDTGRMRG